MAKNSELSAPSKRLSVSTEMSRVASLPTAKGFNSAASMFPGTAPRSAPRTSAPHNKI